jgi:hypothetical protein
MRQRPARLPGAAGSATRARTGRRCGSRSGEEPGWQLVTKSPAARIGRGSRFSESELSQPITEGLLVLRAEAEAGRSRDYPNREPGGSGRPLICSTDSLSNHHGAACQYDCVTESTLSRGWEDPSPLMPSIVQWYRSDRVMRPQSLVPHVLFLVPTLWSGNPPNSS